MECSAHRSFIQSDLEDSPLIQQSNFKTSFGSVHKILDFDVISATAGLGTDKISKIASRKSESVNVFAMHFHFFRLTLLENSTFGYKTKVLEDYVTISIHYIQLV
jgi:hypothetical protein